MGSHKSREKIELFLPKCVTLLKNSVFSCLLKNVSSILLKILKIKIRVAGVANHTYVPRAFFKHKKFSLSSFLEFFFKNTVKSFVKV